MEILSSSFLLIFLSEMGDKTQLLALLLAAKFKRPAPIMWGILVATLVNHGLASYLGAWAASWVSAEILRWVLAATFLAFAVWMLIPDKMDGLGSSPRWGPFWTTTVVFFCAEMGDKTQLATAALGAKFAAPLLVTLGTTVGMLAADGLAVALGHKFTDRLPIRVINVTSAILFLLLALLLVSGTF